MFNRKYNKRRQQVENLMLNYVAMSDGHLGRVSVVRQSIELTIERAPILSHPYCTGPSQKQL